MHNAAHRNQVITQIAGNGVYERVKARIIAHELPPGKRIMVEPLADQFFVSITPVREALIRLAAEHVINDVPKAGFFVKEISASEIEGLYALQQLLLDWSLSTMENDGRTPGILKPPDLFDGAVQEKEIPSRAAVRIMGELFVHISRQSGNPDVIYMTGNINDRTHFVRQKYFEVFEDAGQSLLRLCRAYREKDFDQLREDLRAYFHYKMDRLPDLLRALRGSLLKISA